MICVIDSINAPTTLVGFGCLALMLLIKDWVTIRNRNIRDDKKVDELSAQTIILTQIRDGQDSDKQKNKKTRVRIKRMSEQVNELHSQTVKSTQRKT